jgi:putative transcriptional regulator
MQPGSDHQAPSPRENSGRSTPDPKLREKHNLTQDEFAHLLKSSVGTLRNWGQDRRKPEGPARVLLNITDRHPEALLAL